MEASTAEQVYNELHEQREFNKFVRQELHRLNDAIRVLAYQHPKIKNEILQILNPGCFDGDSEA